MLNHKVLFLCKNNMLNHVIEMEKYNVHLFLSHASSQFLQLVYAPDKNVYCNFQKMFGTYHHHTVDINKLAHIEHNHHHMARSKLFYYNRSSSLCAFKRSLKGHYRSNIILAHSKTILWMTSSIFVFWRYAPSNRITIAYLQFALNFFIRQIYWTRHVMLFCDTFKGNKIFHFQVLKDM